MTIRRLRRFLPFVPARRTARRSISSLILLALMVMGLPALSGAQQTCQPDGDVDQNGSVTAADALLAFQQALSLADLSACQLSIADVFPQPATPDGSITASDALCIFQKALGLPSCLGTSPPSNQPPVADAGLDQLVYENEVVTLAGSGSDADGDIVSYLWEQTGGADVVLSDAETATASFIAPEVSMQQTLTFHLTVTDDEGAGVTSDELTVTVRQVENQPPVADAGSDQSVYQNEVVTLAGSGSDADGTIVRYRWVQTSGTTVVLLGADSQNASFTAPEVAPEDFFEELEFQLTVTDDDGASDTAIALVVVFYGSLTNEPPTANAGPDQRVGEGTLVTLAGSGTDSDGTIIAYDWFQIGGTPVELFDWDTPNPSFTAPEIDADEELVFELAVFDNELGVATDTVTITVSDSSVPTPNEFAEVTEFETISVEGGETITVAKNEILLYLDLDVSQEDYEAILSRITELGGQIVGGLEEMGICSRCGLVGSPRVIRVPDGHAKMDDLIWRES